MSNLTTIIQAGLNNPDCAFYTGAFVGSFFVIKWVFVLMIVGVLFKCLDKLALEPLLEFIKKKIFRRGDK